MKAKRAKRFRKTMSMYQMHFGFREPYQVLITSDCLRALHRFAMPIGKFFENTLDGKVTPYITQCTLAKVMDGFSGKGPNGRPHYLPPPTDVPLRYCKHKDSEGKERGAVPEAECLLDLISGHAKGNELRKNRQHFILGCADWDEGARDQEEREIMEKKRRQRARAGQPDQDVRQAARQIPGVPIVYVKKSVMELEALSGASERAVRGIEKEKYKDGVGGATRGSKRAREDSDNDEDLAPKSIRPAKKVKGVNPLAMKKKQAKPRNEVQPDQTGVNKKKRRRGNRGKVDNANTLDGSEDRKPETIAEES